MPETTSTPTAKPGIANKPVFFVFLAVTAVVIVAAVAFGVYSISQNSARANSQALDFTQLDPNDSAKSTQVLNENTETLVQAVAEDGPQGLLKALGNIDRVAQSEFAFEGSAKTAEFDITFVVDGAMKQLSDIESLVRGTLTLNGSYLTEDALNGSSIDMNNTTLDFVVNNEKAYIKFANVPFEFGFLLASFGLEEDQWYSINLDSAAAASTFESDEPDAQEVKDLLEKLENQPLFTSTTPTDPKSIDGASVPCMNVQVNPAYADESMASFLTATDGFELCVNPGQIFPFFIGADGVEPESGTEFSIGFTWKNVNEEVVIEIPDDAKSLDEIAKSVSSGA